MGRAITFVFLGWSVASVVGMPMASLIGGTFGWRYAFAAVGILGFLGTGWVWFSMRSNVRPPALSVQSWRQTLGSKPLMLCILVTVLYSAGQFVLFSYFAPYFKFMLNISPAELSMLFACFGTFGLVGNVIMTRYIDRWGAPRCIMIAMASMALSLLIWPWGVNFVAAALVSIPWALGCFSANSAQQARLAGIAPALASATIALNTSAMYAGQAAGSATGGWLISHGMLTSLHWYGFGGLLLAMLLSWRASASHMKNATPLL
jgi:predicted MFS family arabinose efflux permease